MPLRAQHHRLPDALGNQFGLALAANHFHLNARLRQDVAHQIGPVARDAHGAGGRGAHLRRRVQFDFLLKTAQRLQGAGVGHGRNFALADAALAQAHAHLGAHQLVQGLAGPHFHNKQVERVGTHVDKGQAAVKYGCVHELVAVSH